MIRLWYKNLFSDGLTYNTSWGVFDTLLFVRLYGLLTFFLNSCIFSLNVHFQDHGIRYKMHTVRKICHWSNDESSIIFTSMYTFVSIYAALENNIPKIRQTSTINGMHFNDESQWWWTALLHTISNNICLGIWCLVYKRIVANDS